jgi:predicted transcriptional regulator
VAILEDEVWVVLSSHKVKHFESLGYHIPRQKDKRGRMVVPKETKILVKIEDLQSKSSQPVTKVCDECGKYVFNQSYVNIISKRKNGDGKDRCFACGCKKSGETLRSNLKYEHSLEYFSIKKDKVKLMNEFSDKNDKRPKEIAAMTHDKYIWNCEKCKSEYDMSVVKRTSRNSNCPYCSGFRVNHTNCLWATNPDVAELLTNPQLGYEYTNGNHTKLEFTCLDCGNKQFKNVASVVRQRFSCARCSDGKSYPEKFIGNLLDQLKIEYDTEKIFKWSNKRRYDIYIPLLNSIIEIHGNQHYNDKNGIGIMGRRSFMAEVENDIYKMNLAIDNEIKNYIVIDCRESNLTFIKNSVINSKLSDLLNLNEINWLSCHQFACSTIVKTICQLWNEGKKTSEIAEILKLSNSTVIKYLKQGNDLNWCQYNSIASYANMRKEQGKRFEKEIVQLTLTNQYIKTWSSASEAGKSLNIFSSNISAACTGKVKTSNGFKWMHKDKYIYSLNEREMENNSIV